MIRCKSKAYTIAIAKHRLLEAPRREMRCKAQRSLRTTWTQRLCRRSRARRWDQFNSVAARPHGVGVPAIPFDALVDSDGEYTDLIGQQVELNL